MERLPSADTNIALGGCNLENFPGFSGYMCIAIGTRQPIVCLLVTHLSGFLLSYNVNIVMLYSLCMMQAITSIHYLQAVIHNLALVSSGASQFVASPGI